MAAKDRAQASAQPVVLVLASGRGDELATEDLIGAMKEMLLPQTTLLTPNSLEARRLADEDNEDEPDLEECARRLIEMGAGHVLLTGAHEATPQVVNTLYGPNGVLRTDAWERLPGGFHGAGDTLSAALTALLAQGLDLSEAAHAAQDYTWHCLAQGWRLGMGQTIPNRFCTEDEA